jgi:hypothetical protein
MARHTFGKIQVSDHPFGKIQVSDHQISRICNYLMPFPVRQVDVWLPTRPVRDALGLRPIRDKPEGEGQIPGKIVREQSDEAVSLTSPETESAWCAAIDP